MIVIMSKSEALGVNLFRVETYDKGIVYQVNNGNIIEECLRKKV